MTVAWIERFRGSAGCGRVLRFFDSNYFPICLCAAALVSNTLGLDIAGYAVFVACAVFINLFSDQTRAGIPVLLLGVFSTSAMHSPGYSDGSNFYMTAPVLATLGSFAVILACSLVFHLTYYGGWRRMLRGSRLLPGLVVLCGATMLNGLFSPHYRPVNLLIGLLQLFSLLLVYLFFSATYRYDKKDLVYLARICALAGILIAVELLFVYTAKYEWGSPLNNDWKGQIIIGWGVSNIIGIMMVILLPMYFYLMQADKPRGWLYYIGAVAVTVAIFYTLSRAAFFLALPVFFAGAAISCLLKGNRRLYQIMTGAIAAAAVVVGVLLFDSGLIDELLGFFKEVKLNDRGRFELWKKDIDFFLAYPLFGGGFAVEQVVNMPHRPIFHTFSHNTVMQMLGKCGLIGLAAYLYHCADTVRLYLTRPTLDRLFMGASVACFVITGLLDNGFFYVFTTFYYSLFLLFTERGLEAEDAAAFRGSPLCKPKRPL
ncbi:MAG: O-antigen ligase family protein [Clostridiales bacterium]|nr:O-antigen ligase family protein [Clostridiales bacterium]